MLLCQQYLKHQPVIDGMIALSRMTELIVLLYDDLKSNNTTTLKEWQSNFHFKYPPVSKAQRDFMQLMRVSIAVGLAVQRGREYVFDKNKDKRATDLSQVTDNILRKLPTHNIDCERELSILDRKVESIIGVFNQFSTFKGLRDEMILHTSECVFQK